MKKMWMVVAVAFLLCGRLLAQDVTGDWQGSLNLGGGSLRFVMKVVKKGTGELAAKLYNADRATQPVSTSSFTVSGSAVRFSVDQMGVVYEGKLSADGKKISGGWNQGGAVTPVELLRATPQTAWEIPAAPAAPKAMAADANPGFDVATIKPNVSGAVRLQQLTMNGRNFVLKNGSLGDLIVFAYNVQLKQIVNGPDWMEKDRYDIAGVPDVEGAPSVDQLRMMVRKLLAERFALKVHDDKREMPAFVLTVAKTGQKLTASDSTNSMPSVGMRGVPNGMTLLLSNATVRDFTSFLQMMVLDRPVVDETRIAGRYDLTVNFLPDDSMFNGRPPRATVADGTEPAPNLYDAIEQQLGMKLSQEKALVDVIAIDHVEKPSPN